MSLHPSAAVLILNYNGREHLARCLPSLAALDYPRFTCTVVDNGSTDGSEEFVKREFPEMRVIALGTNRGFAPAYNEAIRHATEDIVVLLNNDTRVERTWLTGLVDVIERRQVSAAASCMVDWDGRRVDFVGGLPTFVGHAWQVDQGKPVGRAYEETPLLFGCGGSLAIRRDTYLEVGGFDDDYFAYFEDVDLGWRMSLAGHTTCLAPNAITYHRLHGTATGWGHSLRLRLYERNALFTIFKNYGDEALRRVLPAAITLTLARALAAPGLDGHAVGFHRSAPETMALPSAVVATLVAVEDFSRALPRLREKRRHVQATRRRSDEELFTLFPEPLKLHGCGDAYREAAEALVHDFRIAELFGIPARVRVAVPTTAGSATVERPRPGVVSVIVLTASGAAHLPDCLDSLRSHAWPADRTEVIVVDNGSPEDPSAVAEKHYPGVRVVRTGANLGFSGGNNAGAKVATGEYLVFVNDDTRVAPSWLDELVRVAERRQAAAVGALMLDWAGERVDFAGGLVNFEGRGIALHYDDPVETVEPVEQPALFACGGAVLFRRDVFESAGGWDEPTFAYYEDVEFGWRLWMLGYEVWLAPKAIVYHKHHGTSGAGHDARARAFERNGLRMIYALLEEDRLQRVLPTALLMAADRALLATPFSRAAENEGESSAGPGLPSLQTFTAPLRHALIRRGVRKSLGLSGSLRKVGLGGLASAVREAVRDVRFGRAQGGARARYLIERQGAAAAPERRDERVPPVAGATLLGIQDFLRMLPALSARRASLQARRKRSDEEILSRFGGRWTAPVPSVRQDLHATLREQVMDVLRLGG